MCKHESDETTASVNESNHLFVCDMTIAILRTSMNTLFKFDRLLMYVLKGTVTA